MSGLDIAFLAAMFFGALMGFAQGLSGEILSCIKIIAATIVTSLLMGKLSAALPFGGLTADIVVGILGSIVFFILLLLLGLITFQINFIISAILPDMINKPLGIIVGALKMFIILSLGFYFIYNAYHKNTKDDPAWVKEMQASETLYNVGDFLVGNFVNFKADNYFSKDKKKDKKGGFSLDDLEDNIDIDLDALRSYIDFKDGDEDEKTDKEEDAEEGDSKVKKSKSKDLDIGKTFESLDSLLSDIGH